ncbi:hypothetical protein HWV62_19221 [Athelia sp. TMB]|nr:hypothetical protein HWV62_19221 [Athelia sp. TMB]
MALHTSTILARTPAAIFSHLSRLQTTYEKHVLLFCLSANSPDLQNLVSRLTSFSSQTTGCLSAPLGETGDLISCSLAIFDKTKTTQFRSTIAGRVAPQVGRWHAFRHKGKGPQPPMELDGLGEQEKGFENVDWDAVWDRSARSAMLPEELEGLSGPKLGLLASSTPFITGRPVTLFHNGGVHSTGAVGLALTGQKETRTASVESEGNLVNTIDDGNPSRLLLAAIQKAGIETVASFKDAEFYLGAFRGEELSQVYRITSGDPSRGTIALESHAAPIAGTTVRLFHRAELPDFSAIPHQFSSTGPLAERHIAFLASSADMPPTPLQVDDMGKAEEAMLLSAFVGASENGFVVSRNWDGQAAPEGLEAAWKCTVAGGLGGLSWL